MNLVQQLYLIASSRESDLNDDGHIIAEGAKRIEELERILNMTDAEIIAEVGGEEEAERLAAEGRAIFERALQKSNESR